MYFGGRRRFRQFGELALFLAHLRVRPAAVVARAGLQLGAVDGHVARLDESRAPAQFERLDEELGERLEMLLAEAGDGVVIRMLVGGEVAEGDAVVGGLLDAARTGEAGGVAIEQQPREHFRVIARGAAAVLAPVGFQNRIEIQLADDLGDEAGQVIFRQPVVQGRRQQERLIESRGSKSLHLAIG